MSYQILIPDETRIRLAEYLKALQSCAARAGARLTDDLRGKDLATLTEAGLQDTLLNTKVPLIFAESAVVGNGSDWNLVELRLLGDISIAVPVTVYDNVPRSSYLPPSPYRTWAEVVENNGLRL